MHGLFFRLLMRPNPRSSSDSLQRLIDTRFKLSETGEFFEEPLIEILEIEGHNPHANGVARTTGFVSLPAADSVAFDGQQLLDESLLGWAVLLCMNTDRELLLLHLAGLNEGFKMNSALVVVVPIILVQLQILAPVVDVPIVGKPAGRLQPLFKIAENGFRVFHLSITRQ